MFVTFWNFLPIDSSIYLYPRMPSNAAITPRKVRAIFKLRAERPPKSWKFIGALFGQKKSWASEVAKRHDPLTFSPLKERGQIGRPRKFGDNLDETVEKFVMTFRQSTSKDISEALKDIYCAVSARTIRRYLANLGFRKVGAVKDVLTADHKLRRLNWCLDKQRQMIVNPNLFDNWLISDEVRVSLDGQCRPQVSRID